MSIETGICTICGLDTEILDNKCVTCIRLEKLEKDNENIKQALEIFIKEVDYKIDTTLNRDKYDHVLHLIYPEKYKYNPIGGEQSGSF